MLQFWVYFDAQAITVTGSPIITTGAKASRMRIAIEMPSFS